jgi:hypothetical protein
MPAGGGNNEIVAETTTEGIRQREGSAAIKNGESKLSFSVPIHTGGFIQTDAADLSCSAALWSPSYLLMAPCRAMIACKLQAASCKGGRLRTGV